MFDSEAKECHFLYYQNTIFNSQISLLQLRCKISIKTRSYLTRKCLHKFSNSSFELAFRHGFDIDFMNLTGLYKHHFLILLNKFKKCFNSIYNINNKNAKKIGRPASIKLHGLLGLILVFYRDPCDLKALCLIFGLTPACTSRYIRIAEIILYNVLQKEDLAQFKWPSKQHQLEWGQLVNKKYPLVFGRWGFIDGKNYPVEKPTNAELQNAMYNGWLHSTLITGTLCFGVDGTIVWGRHNFVGSWNDGETSRSFQEKLQINDINLEHHGVLSDSAFPCKAGLEGKIISPLKFGDLNKIDITLHQEAEALSSAITSARQSCEWGMGAVEKVYRRLLRKLPFDKDLRRIRLDTIYRLYNYRVRTTGISEIRTHYFS